MTIQSILDLADFLEAKAKTVREIEAESKHIIDETGNQEAFNACIRKKAELLAVLYNDTETLANELPDQVRDEISERLEAFSSSAQMSMKVGSVFFMTALLYPEDHVEGEKNDLENYVDYLRGLEI